MDEQKLTRARELITARDAIDVELDGMFSGMPVAKRGRPRKDQVPAGSSEAQETHDQTETT